MASRPVRTCELRVKHRMSQPQVLDVLKKAKIKPVEKIDMGKRGIGLMWPNREANAVLRAFREEKPAKRMANAPTKRTNVRNFEAFKENKHVANLTKEVAQLSRQVAALVQMWQPNHKVG